MKTPQEWVDHLTLEPMTETQANQGVRVTRLEIAEIQSDARAEVEQRVKELEESIERGKATNRMNYEAANATLAKLDAAIERERVLSEMLRVQTEALGIANGKLLKFIDGRDQSEQRERVLREALGIDTPRPIWDVLDQSHSWLGHLQIIHDCDCRGHEAITEIRLAACKQSEQIKKALAATGKEGK